MTVQMDNIIKDVIKFLNPIFRYKYPIKGFYRDEKGYAPPILMFYGQYPEFRYLVKVEPIYIIDLKTLHPTMNSTVQNEIPDELKIRIKVAMENYHHPITKRWSWNWFG